VEVDPVTAFLPPPHLESPSVHNYYDQPGRVYPHIQYNLNPSQSLSTQTYVQYQRVSAPQSADNWTYGPTHTSVSGSLGSSSDVVSETVVDVDTVSTPPKFNGLDHP
jgi:hypothetical protein